MCIIMKHILLAAFIVVCFCFVTSAKLHQVYVIVNMENAPVEILEFRQCHAEKTDHICSQVKYKNRTNKDIEALAITMIYFDAFNDKLNGVRGISTGLLKAQGEDAGHWSICVGEPSFVKTAMALVSVTQSAKKEFGYIYSCWFNMAKCQMNWFVSEWNKIRLRGLKEFGGL